MVYTLHANGFDYSTPKMCVTHSLCLPPPAVQTPAEWELASLLFSQRLPALHGSRERKPMNLNLFSKSNFEAWHRKKRLAPHPNLTARWLTLNIYTLFARPPLAIGRRRMDIAVATARRSSSASDCDCGSAGGRSGARSRPQHVLCASRCGSCDT